MDTVDVQNKHLVLDDKFKVEAADVRFRKFDGQMSNSVRRLVFLRGESAAAIVFNTDTQQVLLTRQFRYPTYENGPGWMTEVVAGVVDEGEKPEQTIKREIGEEIGYQVHDVTPIATFYVSPGGTSERISLYYAEVTDADHTSQGGGLAAENEDIQLVTLSLPELWQALDSGTIQDAKTLIGAQWLRLKFTSDK
jgi:nudix-type nucleoside diphosphatase (YffH/AdpP family)